MKKRIFFKLLNNTCDCLLNDNDFLNLYNKEKRKEKFCYYVKNAVMDYLYNFSLLDKEYLDICHLPIKCYGKKYIIDLDCIYDLFEESLKDC